LKVEESRILSEKKDTLPKIICICPMCKIEYRRELRWIGGNITPRIFCEECKPTVNTKSKLQDMEEHRVLYSSNVEVS
jgi:hypothetical protein